MTHTFALLPVSQSAYDEIRDKLLDVGYDHTLTPVAGDKGGQCITAIDMHGVGLIPIQQEDEDPCFNAAEQGEPSLPPDHRKPHRALVAFGQNRHCVLIAYQDDERPGREIAGDGSDAFGEPGVLDIEFGMEGYDMSTTGLMDTDTPDDPGLWVWEGRLYYKPTPTLEEPHDSEPVWRGEWRAATFADLQRFRVQVDMTPVGSLQEVNELVTELIVAVGGQDLEIRRSTEGRLRTALLALFVEKRPPKPTLADRMRVLADEVALIDPAVSANMQKAANTLDQNAAHNAGMEARRHRRPQDARGWNPNTDPA